MGQRIHPVLETTEHQVGCQYDLTVIELQHHAPLPSELSSKPSGLQVIGDADHCDSLVPVKEQQRTDRFRTIVVEQVVVPMILYQFGD
jgi:hypothetical protein